MRQLFPSLSTASGAVLLALLISTPAMAGSTVPAGSAEASNWAATWQASPQPVWEADFLFPTNLPAVLQDQTVRQVARISLGGPRLRIVLSNAYGGQPVTVGRATVAKPLPEGAIDAGSLQAVTFGGGAQATIAAGASLVSDPVALPLASLSQVAVSLYLPGAMPVQSFHWDGRQTGWIVAGDQSAAAALRTSDPGAISSTARPLLAGIQVEANPASPAAPVVAVMGDSITDGATASLDRDSRWPDFLAARLAPHGAAVVNAGISGARLLSDGMGEHALARLERDVLAQPGVRSLIVLLGINDISWPGTAFARQAPRPTLQDMAEGYRQLVARARSHGLRVIGATLPPFEGALPGTPLDDYYEADKDDLRRQVNAWIRLGGAFDAVIDFDAVLRDGAHPSRIAARFDSGDRLHPGDEGNRAMADAVDLNAILPGLLPR
ncbi:SGNH/GDSL hydrolase family protein [Delftia acidovorans]|uniref:SGNH/GDSL hydrolase family protein n=1 Tax=Delftia acidovorans TaxID=80866 RepID=UPI002FDCCA7E